MRRTILLLWLGFLLGFAVRGLITGCGLFASIGGC